MSSVFEWLCFQLLHHLCYFHYLYFSRIIFPFILILCWIPMNLPSLVYCAICCLSPIMWEHSDILKFFPCKYFFALVTNVGKVSQTQALILCVCVCVLCLFVCVEIGRKYQTRKPLTLKWMVPFSLFLFPPWVSFVLQEILQFIHCSNFYPQIISWEESLPDLSITVLGFPLQTNPSMILTLLYNWHSKRDN